MAIARARAAAPQFYNGLPGRHERSAPAGQPLPQSSTLAGAPVGHDQPLGEVRAVQPTAPGRSASDTPPASAREGDGGGAGLRAGCPGHSSQRARRPLKNWSEPQPTGRMAVARVILRLSSSPMRRASLPPRSSADPRRRLARGRTPVLQRPSSTSRPAPRSGFRTRGRHGGRRSRRAQSIRNPPPSHSRPAARRAHGNRRDT